VVDKDLDPKRRSFSFVVTEVMSAATIEFQDPGPLLLDACIKLCGKTASLSRKDGTIFTYSEVLNDQVR
jgi:hypothetical protein